MDYTTGQLTNPGTGDNVTVMEFDCTLAGGRFPLDATTQQSGTSTNNPVEVTLNTGWGGFDISDTSVYSKDISAQSIFLVFIIFAITGF